jgi:hypothetical protein
VILRCTKKLFDVIRPGSLEPPVIPLGNDDWYADLLWYDTFKCLLLPHRETLFSIFEPDLNGAQWLNSPVPRRPGPQAARPA